MLELQNRHIRLAIAEDASEVLLEDLRRGCAWRLLPSRAAYRRYAPGMENAYPAIVRNLQAERILLEGGRAEMRGEAIEIRYNLPDGAIRCVWELDDFAVQSTSFSDGTRVVANVSGEDHETDAFGKIPAESWIETD